MGPEKETPEITVEFVPASSASAASVTVANSGRPRAMTISNPLPAHHDSSTEEVTVRVEFTRFGYSSHSEGTSNQTAYERLSALNRENGGSSTDGANNTEHNHVTVIETFEVDLGEALKDLIQDSDTTRPRRPTLQASIRTSEEVVPRLTTDTQGNAVGDPRSMVTSNDRISAHVRKGSKGRRLSEP